MLFDKLTEELTELSEELFGTADIPHVPATVDAPRVPISPFPIPPLEDPRGV